MRAKLAVFASGGGSNLGAILSYRDALGNSAAFDVELVVSNRESAGALTRARERGIPAVVLSDPDDGIALRELLAAREVDLVALAGYLRLLPAEVIAAYPRRILNVHPAPLPRFGGRGMYGNRVHAAVLAAGVAETAVTVHLVDEEYDRGAVVAQWPVKVKAGESPESLAQRVLAVEHVVYPRVIEMVAALISLQT